MIMRVSGLSALGSREQDAALAALTRYHQHLVVVRYWQQPASRTGADAGLPAAAREVSERGVVLDESTVIAHSGCLSCAIVDDLTRLLPELAGTDWARDVLVVLPLGVSANTVLEGCAATSPDAMAPLGLTVGMIAVAVDAAALEDQLWATETLADAHIAVAENDLTLGDYLVGELLLADTQILADPDDVGAEPLVAGVELARHIAPQSRVTAVGTGALALITRPDIADTFDELEADVRTAPGAVSVPVISTSALVSTHVVRVARPLHAGRLAVAMHSVAAGCVWSRGLLWVASMPARRIGWTGVGPTVSFGDAGGWIADGAERFRLDSLALLTWHPEHGDRGTVLAFTGRELDPAELDAALQACALTVAELALGLEHWAGQPDPLELRAAHVHELDHESHNEKE